MIRNMNTQTFTRVVSLGLLTLMVLALVASPSAASRLQDVSPPAAGADPVRPGVADPDFRHEGE